MKDNNNFRFDIPDWLIFLSFVTYAPVGVVLLILKLITASHRKRVEEQQAEEKRRKEDSKKNERNADLKKLRIGSIIALAIGFFFAVMSIDAMDPTMFMIFAFPPLVASIWMATKRELDKKSLERQDRISAILENRPSMNLDKLAAACGTSLKQTRRDLQKLIDKGAFGKKAYIDLGTNNFMRNSFAEPDEPSVSGAKAMHESKAKEESKADKMNENAEGKTEAGDREKFDQIIREIRRLNDDIKDVPVSYRIHQIEEHTKNIFDYVTDHPQAMPQIRTFMNYYLPTTLKLLESYYRIERVGVAGENMKKSKENIENTLDLLVVGFEQQVDQLFKNESMDISSDIAVLETMMKKDGLHQDSSSDLSSLAKQYSDKIANSLSDEQNGGAAAMEKPLS